MIIYKATNKINYKIYIGKTTNPLKKRISQHKGNIKSAKSVFHKALKKYGIENFIFEIVCNCKDEQELSDMEIAKIKEYNSTNIKIGYNRHLGGTGANSGENHPFFGKKRKDISRMFSGDGHPNYGNKGELSPRYGKKHTKKSREKISNSLVGIFSGTKNPNADNKIYLFEHPEHGIVKSTKSELRIKYNLDKQNFMKICNGKRKTHKGWKYLGAV